MSTATAINGRGAATVTTTEKPAPQATPHLDRVVEATAQLRIEDVQTIASQASRSNMYGMTESQAFTLMMIAQAEGIHPVKALLRYHIIFNRPSMRADAMLAEFQARGGRFRWVHTDEVKCVIEAWDPTLHPEHLTFSVTLKELVDRKVACEWDKDKKTWYVKAMYEKYPRQMLRARAASEMVRAINPGVVTGVYTPEEIADFAADGAIEYSEPMPDIERPDPAPAVFPPNHEPKSQEVTPARAWVRDQIQAAKDELRNHLVIDQKFDRYDEAAKLLPRDPAQVAQHLVTDWIARELLDPAEVLGANGKRDNQKVGAALSVAFSQDEDETKSEVRAYIRGKLDAALRSAGVQLAGESDLAQAAADGE